MEGSMLVVGGGVMGRAIVEGGIRAGVLEAGRVVVVEPDPERREALRAMGCHVASSLVGAAMSSEAAISTPVGVAVLAVKPQMFGAVDDDLRGVLEAAPDGPAESPRGVLVISIMAGVRSATIAQRLGAGVRVVRAMPNTPARIGQGVTGIAAGPGATEADLASAQRLFTALGPVVVRIDESLMDAFTALAGSGPAYSFYLAEAMERAGIAMGFDPATARRVVAQTLRGAGGLLDGTTDPAALRAAVTSKGGTTAAALAVLDGDRVGEAWVRAILAARDRGRELAGG